MLEYTGSFSTSKFLLGATPRLRALGRRTSKYVGLKPRIFQRVNDAPTGITPREKINFDFLRET